jgi:DHA2 family integral membrane protein (MFS transporter)
VRGYTALAAGVALLAVAGAVMVVSPLAARLSARFGPRSVTGVGLAVFGAVMLSYGLATRTMPQWVIEVTMAGIGIGMGLVMTPATNSIMSAVPKEKAGAGAGVNNTVRQVAAALGVAVLGSILAVAFRGNLGSGTPAQLARELDQPAAVVAQLPADQQVSTYVKHDASESIGGALEYVGAATGALQERGKSAGLPPAQVQQQREHAQQVIGGFIDDADDSFVNAMRVTSIVAGLVGLLGAVAAFVYMPTRREHAVHTAVTPKADDAAVTAP